jgi:hypothetical protein
MGDDSRVTNELYIKRGCLVLEDFLFFSVYSFSCIASNSTTLKIFLNSCFCSCLSIRTSSSALQHPYYLRPIPPVTPQDNHALSLVCSSCLGSLPSSSIVKLGSSFLSCLVGVEISVQYGTQLNLYNATYRYHGNAIILPIFL